MHSQLFDPSGNLAPGQPGDWVLPSIFTKVSAPMLRLFPGSITRPPRSLSTFRSARYPRPRKTHFRWVINPFRAELVARRAPYATSRHAPLDDSKRPGFPGAPRIDPAPDADRESSTGRVLGAEYRGANIVSLRYWFAAWATVVTVLLLVAANWLVRIEGPADAADFSAAVNLLQHYATLLGLVVLAFVATCVIGALAAFAAVIQGLDCCLGRVAIPGLSADNPADT